MSGADTTGSLSRANKRFRVRARHEDLHHARLLAEPSFHAAAVAYVEHLSAYPDDASEIAVIVQDVETGHEHSFWIHIGPGAQT